MTCAPGWVLRCECLKGFRGEGQEDLADSLMTAADQAVERYAARLGRDELGRAMRDVLAVWDDAASERGCRRVTEDDKPKLTVIHP